ncbi:transposase [Mesorhizobium sp. M0924]|uniref:transposase n=1 Tax=unclassified Mesorhizobium TaxID=325217 RepID=UPI00333C72A2
MTVYFRLLLAFPNLCSYQPHVRLARIVVPSLPRHATQLGNGRAKVFFAPKDYTLYKNLLVEHCHVADVGIWAWSLMPNHVHLILTLADPDGLRRSHQANKSCG